MKNIKIFFLFTILLNSHPSHALVWEMCNFLTFAYTVLSNNQTIQDAILNRNGTVNIAAVSGVYHSATSYASSLWTKLDTFLGRKIPKVWSSEENIAQAERAKREADIAEKARLEAQNKELAEKLEETKRNLEKLKRNSNELQEENIYLKNSIMKMQYEDEITKAVNEANKKKDATILELTEKVNGFDNTKKLEECKKELEKKYEKQLDRYKKETMQYKATFYVLYCALQTVQQYQLPLYCKENPINKNTMQMPQNNCIKSNLYNYPHLYNNNYSNPYYLNLSNNLDKSGKK